MTHPAHAVEVVDVCKSFGDARVLSDVSLQVARGEVLCVLGPSGSGKSTLLRCINHLERPDSGRVYVEGELVGYHERHGRTYEARPREVARKRQRIGMVFQQFNLFTHMSVIQNIMHAPIHVRGESREKAEARAVALLERVGLADKRTAFPDTLSGGQQQRIAIARALAMAPSVMLFDEPTSALDPELVGEVLEVMGRLAMDGMTMIVVTHEIGFAREAADRIAVLDQGRIIEEGETRSVLDDPRSARTREFLSRIRN